MPPTRQKNFLRVTISTVHWINRYTAPIALALAITSIASAFLGVAIASWQTDGEFNFGFVMNWLTSSMYEATQAIVMDMDPDVERSNVLLWLARFTAVLFALMVATKAIGVLFKDSSTQIRLWSRGKRNVLVCGLGRIGSQVTQQLSSNGDFVIVQEQNASRLEIEAARKAGAIVIDGDATDSEAMRDLIYRDPKSIYLVTGNDHSNIEALATVRKLRSDYEQTKARVLGDVDCYVHIADAELEAAVSRCVVEASQKAGTESNHFAAGFRIKVFNIFEETARELIVNALLRFRPTSTDDVALYVVFGFGQMGKAMVKQLTELAHFENDKRARILVLTERAEAKCDDYLADWHLISPRIVHSGVEDVRFDNECDRWECKTLRPKKAYHVDDDRAVEYAANIHFCELATDMLPRTTVDSLVQLVTEPNVSPVALFCFEDDEKNFEMSNQLNCSLRDFHGINVDLQNIRATIDEYPDHYDRKQEFHLPMFIFLPRSRPLRQFLQETETKCPLIPFGDVSRAMERVRDNTIDQIAMVISWDYDKRHARNTETVPTLADYKTQWSSKDFWERHSNLVAAEHWLIKIQLLGYRLLSKRETADRKNRQHTAIRTTDPNLTTEMKALLAKIEHNRWMAERLLMGWKFGPENKEQPPIRRSICPWGKLDGTDVNKDIEQVRAVFQFLIDEGFQFEKIGA